jgi:hypothetical protein
MERFDGITVIAVSVAVVTVRVVLPGILPDAAAVMVVGPAARPDANPWLPTALLMVAIEGSDELHVTIVVTSCVLPSE